MHGSPLVLEALLRGPDEVLLLGRSRGLSVWWLLVPFRINWR